MARTSKKDGASPKKDNASPKKVTKASKKKDSDAPKRATTAYMLWLGENRPRLTKPGMPVTEVAKLAGAEWKTITDKSKWEGLAQADKERYATEMAAYKKGPSSSK